MKQTPQQAPAVALRIVAAALALFAFVSLAMLHSETERRREAEQRLKQCKYYERNFSMIHDN